MKKQLLKSLSAISEISEISIEKRLTGYGAMSVAIAAAFVPSAKAGTVVACVDVTTPVGGGLYFNVVTGAVSCESFPPGSHAFLTPGSAPGSFALSNEVGGSLKKAFVFASSAGKNNKFAVASSAGGLNSSAARLAKNAKIGPGGIDTFANRYSSLASNRPSSVQVGHWNALGTGYLGLEFEVGSQTDYGWAEITVNGNYTITLDSVGYDDSGNPVLAGAAAPTPEPNSLLLMVLGAAGLAAYRRKRAAKRPNPAHAA